MTEQTNSVDRASLRRRVIKGGTIAFNRRQMTYPCMVKDLSEEGARLQIASPDPVPDTFELLVDLDGLEFECEVVWRSEKQVGVRFTSEPQAKAPKRIQVVDQSTANPTAAFYRIKERKRKLEEERQAQSNTVEFRPLYDPD